MKRHPTSKPSGALIRVDPHDLRDHGDDERIERIWSRVEQQLTLAPEATGFGAVTPQRLSRTLVLAAGIAAGFGLGIAASALLAPPTAAPLPVVMAPSLDHSGSAQVFAAGTATNSYALPGGGRLQLSPDSIVDTVARDSSGLTLRLVRGSATLAGLGQDGAAAGSRITLRIGDAQVKSINGKLRVSLLGDSAQLSMLAGSATVSSPHLDNGQERMLRKNQQTTIPTRAITAANDPLTPPLVIAQDSAPPLLAATNDNPAQAEEPDAVRAPWRLACDSANYEEAVKLLKNQASGPHQLTCLATGHMVLKDGTAATAIFKNVIQEFPTSPYASTAAHYLAGLYGAEDKQQSEHYRQMAARLSKGALLSAQALCQKIVKLTATEDAAEVATLSELYKNTYPDGPCINTIDRLLAELASHAADDAADNDAASAPSAGASGERSPHPYDDEAANDAPAPKKP